jgi:hypothetical protein
MQQDDALAFAEGQLASLQNNTECACYLSLSEALAISQQNACELNVI